MRAYFQTESFKKALSRYTPPFLILLVILLAYGWQIHLLGFYWDDWVYIYRYQTMGVFSTIYYGTTRQLGVLALLPGFLFSADSPLRWHIYMLLLRWGGVLCMWWALNRLWPGQRASVTFMALLFSVYPAFTQQSISVVYSLQFFTYAVFFVSLGLMVAAARDERRFWGLTVLALLSQSFHLAIVEYFFGLELIRPLVLFFLQPGSNNLQKAKKALLHWLPYLLVLSVYLGWRLGVFGNGFATYEYKTLLGLFRTDPSGTLLEQSRYALQDVAQVILTTWQTTVQPDLIDWGQPYNFFTLAVALLVTVGLAVFLPRLQLDDSRAKGDSFQSQAISLGLLAVTVGFIPAWFVTRHIIMPGYFGDRFALPSMFGASILLVGLAKFFADPQRRRDVLLSSLLVGLAVGLQMRVANDYRWDWVRQTRTYWQTYWRAPGLKDGTALVGNGAISTTANNYPGIFAYKNLYGQTQTPGSVWYVNYYKMPVPDNLENFLAGKLNYTDQIAQLEFIVTPQNSLGIYYETGSVDARCLKVLGPDELHTSEIPAEYREVARFSQPGLILPEGPLPPAHIFGPEPVNTWCYFYEKAELARQMGDWQQVVKLKKEADRQRFSALIAYENIPFIEAYGMTGDWDAALKLSFQTYKDLKRARDALCLVWNRLENNTADQAGYAVAFRELNGQLGCR
jgi:hypothetical protein